MNRQDVNREALAQTIRAARRPLHINVLARTAARAWLEIRVEVRLYAPGSRYEVGETVLLGEKQTTVEAVQQAENPVQGPFAILTLRFPDGTERLMAAEVPGAPAEDHQPVTEKQVDEMLGAQGLAIRRGVQAALRSDPRFVSFQTTQGELWCLEELLPEVGEEALQKVLAVLSQAPRPGETELPSYSTEELVRVAWGIEDDGSAAYALHAFALGRALAGRADVVNLGDRWASAEAWRDFTTRSPITTLSISTQVTLPDGVEPATEEQVERERRRERADGGEEPEVERPEEDLETWREDRPVHAVFTLRARHYYEGWLPLTGQVRRLFPPLASGRQEVIFHHHFGDEPGSFRAWVDREQGRIWVSPEMHETFRRHRIYPGARLRISARNEREYDIATRPTDRTDPIHVWRMWLDEDRQIQYEAFEEPRRYDVDDDVYVADVRFEDLEALFCQAEEVGNSIFGLMYQKAVEWWEAGGRKDLIVTADQLFEAIHFDEEGRMVSKATIAWELWQRLAFEPVGGGRYRFRPEFGDQVRSTRPVPRRRRRSRRRTEPASSATQPRPTIPPISLPEPNLPLSDQKERIVQHLQKHGIALRKQGTLYHLQERLAIVFYSFRRQGDQYWFGPSPSVLDRARKFRDYFMLLILDSAETVLVLPGQIVESLISAGEPRSGHYHIHVLHRSSRYLLRELDDRDITSYLNAFDLILEAAGGSARTRHDVEAKLTSQMSRSEIDAEFQQIQEIIRTSLVGKTICAPENYPHTIGAAHGEGLHVSRPTRDGWMGQLVDWRRVKSVYTALCWQGILDRRNARTYLDAFIFRLLSRFAHIEFRPKPRQMLIYRRPDGPIRLRGSGQEKDVNHSLGQEMEPSIPKDQELNSSFVASPPKSLKKVPGSVTGRGDMQSKALFSRHYLANRLPDHPEWAEDPRAVFEAVRALWQKARQHGDSWNEAQTEEEFVRPVLELLGWSYIVQPKAKRGGRVSRPDYALFPDEKTRNEAYPYQGRDVPFYSRALAIAEAKYWGRPLSQKDASGRDTWKADSNPSFQMVNYLVGTGVSWGILTNGVVWRLYGRGVSSIASEFYEVDLGAIFDFLPPDGEPSPEQLDQFRRWWLFFRRDAFLPDAQGKSFVQRVHEGSATYARLISDKLKELVFEQVMPEIAGGFVAYRHHKLGVQEETEESLQQIYQASLSLLYKLLFLFYAEARGLLPITNPGYREQSLTALAQWAAERLDKGLPISDAVHATPKYGALLDLFHRIDQGDSSLGIPRYNGGLFNPSNPENQFLEKHRLSDRVVARAVDILARDAGEPVDYAYISVRNLGAIYEGLLEYKLRVVDAPKGRVELVTDKGERKATGSYYTPDYIVNYIVQHTLEPILDERDQAFRAAMDRCADLRRKLADGRRSGASIPALRQQLEEAEREAREAFLGIKVLDPAMGSGHFLVNAVDFLTDGVIRRMQAYHDEHPDVPWEWNPIQRLIERVRGEILAEMARQGIEVDPSRLDNTAILTRLVMKRCIYGVDLNRMAVELAKVSLWLHSFTVGAPLSFLDHHLRWGNSLIGTDVRTVEREIQTTDRGEGVQLGLFAGPFAGLLDLTGLMVEVAEQADATLADVQHSAKVFDQFQKQLIPYKQVLDLWVSRYFGNEPAYEFLTVHGAEVLPVLRGEKEVPEEYREAVERARALWREKRFFHWDLEFPEVFIDLRKRDWAESPGFDAVIGNPPYVNANELSKILSEFEKPFWKTQFQSAVGAYDLYVLFLEQAIKLTRPGCFASMITPNKFLSAPYARAFREFVSRTASFLRLLNLSHIRVFEDPSIYPVVSIFQTVDPKSDYHVVVETPLDSEDASRTRVVEQQSSDLDKLPEMIWGFLISEYLPLVLKAEDLSVQLQHCSTVRASSTASEADAFGDALLNAPIDHPKKFINTGLIDRYDVLWGTQPLTHKGRTFETPYLQLSHPCVSNERKEQYDSPKIVFAKIARRIEGFLDRKGEYASANTNFAYDSVYKLRYLVAVLNSKLLSVLYEGYFGALAMSGGYFQFQAPQLRVLPIRRIAFITPVAEREPLVEEGKRLTNVWVAARRGEIGTDGRCTYSISQFLNDNVGLWIGERLSPTHPPDPELVRQHNADPLNENWQLPEEGPVEQTDVVHDLLAHLAERMIEMNREKQAEVRGFLTWLEREMGASIDDLTNKTKLRNYLGDYQKGEPHLTLEELLTILRKNRRRLKVAPSKRAFQEQLEQEYQASLGKLLPLKARLAATDRLIDLIVYRLYGLTEKEVVIVEGKN